LLRQRFDLHLQAGQLRAFLDGQSFCLFSLILCVVEATELDDQDGREQHVASKRNNQAGTQPGFDDGNGSDCSLGSSCGRSLWYRALMLDFLGGPAALDPGVHFGRKKLPQATKLMGRHFLAEGIELARAMLAAMGVTEERLRGDAGWN
jgi:hypothetical protein